MYTHIRFWFKVKLFCLAECLVFGTISVITYSISENFALFLVIEVITLGFLFLSLLCSIVIVNPGKEEVVLKIFRRVLFL